MSIFDNVTKALNENPRAYFLTAIIRGNPNGTAEDHARAADGALAEFEKRCAPPTEPGK